MLSLTIYLSMLGAVLLWLQPRASARSCRIIALLTSGMALACAIGGTVQHLDLLRKGGLVTVTHLKWIPQLGIEYFLAADGISATLLILTGIAACAGILFSWITGLNRI